MLIKIFLSKIKDWFISNKSNLITYIPTVLLIGMLIFHFFFTKNPPITQPVIISPITENKTLDNGQAAQIKAYTPSVDTPEQAGFSESYINDTINKIIGIKNKEILAINQIKGNYLDSLQFVKEELDEKARVVKYYESKDSKGNVVGSGKVVGSDAMVYKGDINLTSVVKKSKNKKLPDSLIFYDPTGRVTINQSKEFSQTIPKETVKKRFTFSIQGGAGTVVPQFDMKKATFGGYLGGGVSYNF
mgnify:CR=1 FL=1